MTPDLLEIVGLGKRYGGVLAVDGLNMTVGKGSIHGLIGPNGAGKTTTFNLVSGYDSPTAGVVRFRGETISGLPMYRIAQKGIVRTFQHSTLFAELSVLENALIGTHIRFRPGFLGAVTGHDRKTRNQALDVAGEALEFFGLTGFAHNPAGDLSHGHQRALGMAIALAADPEIVLLDEPFTGMNPEETRVMMDLMFKLRDKGVTILIVEHDMHAIMGLCDVITVMSFGRLLTEGQPRDIRHHPEVIEAYLGSAADADPTE